MGMFRILVTYFVPDPLCPVCHGGRDDDIFHRSVPGIIGIYSSPVVPASNRCREVKQNETKGNQTKSLNFISPKPFFEKGDSKKQKWFENTLC